MLRNDVLMYFSDRPKNNNALEKLRGFIIISEVCYCRTAAEKHPLSRVDTRESGLNMRTLHVLDKLLTISQGTVVLTGKQATENSSVETSIIICAAQDRYYTLQAKSAEEANRWVNAIHIAIDESAYRAVPASTPNTRKLREKGAWMLKKDLKRWFLGKFYAYPVLASRSACLYAQEHKRA